MPSIDYAAFKRSLERQPAYPVYVLFGDEPFFFEEGTTLLKRALLPSAETSTVSHFDAAEVGLAEILDELRTESLFAPNRMVVVENATKLLQVRAAREALDSDETAAENEVPDTTGNRVPVAAKVLDSYLDRPAPRAFLMLKCPLSDRKKQLHFSAKMRKAALLVRCPRVYDNQLVRWATAQMRDLGYRLAREAGRVLVDYVGSNLYRLNGELGKLALNAGERKNSIEVADVLALVGADPSASILALAEAVANKDVEPALLVLRQITQHGRLDASGILALLGRLYLRRLWEVAELRRTGLSREEIASRLGLKDYPLSRIENQLSKFSPDELRQKLKALVDTDFAVKTSRLPDTTALEILVIELCR